MLRDAFVLKIQRELCHPKCGREVSGLSRNGPFMYSANVCCRVQFTQMIRMAKTFIIIIIIIVIIKSIIIIFGISFFIDYVLSVNLRHDFQNKKHEN